MTKQVKATLDDELEEMFERMKKDLGLTVDAEVLRQTLILRYREMYPEENIESGKEAVSIAA